MKNFTTEQLFTLINNSQNGSRKADNILLDQFQRLVIKEARRFSPSRVLGMDDYISYGRVGLINAISKFDTTKGYPFLPYAQKCIYNAIVGGIKRDTNEMDTHLVSFEDDKGKERDAYDGTDRCCHFNDCDDTEGNPNMFDTDYYAYEMDRESRRALLNCALNRLSEKEREVITLKMGLNGQSPMELKDIAQMRNVSHEAVRKLAIRAEENLRKILKNMPEWV